jgi:hypothetical protein
MAGVVPTVGRAALALREDVLRPTSRAFVNPSSATRRTLIGHPVALELLRNAKRDPGVTTNDVCLAAVAGALRHLAIGSGEQPRALKAMIPVNIRDGENLGNRISLAFIKLPVDAPTAAERLSAPRSSAGGCASITISSSSRTLVALQRRLLRIRVDASEARLWRSAARRGSALRWRHLPRRAFGGRACPRGMAMDAAEARVSDASVEPQHNGDSEPPRLGHRAMADVHGAAQTRVDAQGIWQPHHR